MSSVIFTNTFSSFQHSKNEDGKDILTVSDKDKQVLKYPHWAPAWDPEENLAFESFKPFLHVDRGLFGDPEFKSLLKVDTVHYKPITPKLGLEVEGIQLSKLTNKQKDDLALLVEQRGVVVFRNQDLKDESFDDLKKWGRYFGPLHVHPNSGAPLNNPEFHIVYKSNDTKQKDKIFSDKLNNIRWHSDVSYETQTPGITFLTMLETGLGGDTQYIDCIEVYDRLSPLLKEKLDGLKVLHSSKRQAYYSNLEGRIQRKEEIESIHPLVRYHPVLKKKFLFFNKNFARRILGLKQEESDNLIEFLVNHYQTCLDAHIRANWDDNTVVAWDNRRVLHSATPDWDGDTTRHAFRITTLAERPVGSEQEYKDWTPELENENLKIKDHLLSLSAAEYYDYTKGLK